QCHMTRTTNRWLQQQATAFVTAGQASKVSTKAEEIPMQIMLQWRMLRQQCWHSHHHHHYAKAEVAYQECLSSGFSPLSSFPHGQIAILLHQPLVSTVLCVSM